MYTRMEELLELTGIKPETTDQQRGAPAMCLAMHCIMLEAGFKPKHDDPEVTSPYAPASTWNPKGAAAWTFQYSLDGCPNPFEMHCSLDAHHGKLLVTAEEKGTRNIHVLGLMVWKYVPKPDELAKGSWRGVIQKQEDLNRYFEDYITGPLFRLVSQMTPRKVSVEKVPPVKMVPLSFYAPEPQGWEYWFKPGSMRTSLGIGIAALGLVCLAAAVSRTHFRPTT